MIRRLFVYTAHSLTNRPRAAACPYGVHTAKSTERRSGEFPALSVRMKSPLFLLRFSGEYCASQNISPFFYVVLFWTFLDFSSPLFIAFALFLCAFLLQNVTMPKLIAP